MQSANARAWKVAPSSVVMAAIWVPIFPRRPFLQAVVHLNLDACLGEHLAQDLFAHVRLVEPGHLVRKPPDIVFDAHAPVEFQCKAADDFLLSEVRARKPAGRHPTQVASRLEQGHLQAFPGGRDCGDHPAGRPAVNHEVVGLARRRRRGQRENQERFEHVEIILRHAVGCREVSSS